MWPLQNYTDYFVETETVASGIQPQTEQAASILISSKGGGVLAGGFKGALKSHSEN